ncbi:GNAT family N-acetyltransferase [Pantoea sp. 1.19]|uniref:GNAT family N-acetyltransferase n=1 Tax=Pantoea sp. 1.19 TaxID=1925589 RepID=UPI000948BD2A|nr:GNAT family N-acetyltransferase [Pantoea sp. 1.19]
MHKLHAEYVRLGLLSPQPGDVLFSPWFFSPGNQLFVARVDQQLAGTIGFIRQSEQGMPAEKVSADVIAACGCRAEKTAEIGALCIDARYRGTGMLRTLYAWMMLYALFHQRVDTLFIQVEKRKARFYQDLLFFRQLGESRVHPDYQGREVALLHADVRAVAQTLRGAIQAGKGSGLRQLLASWQVEHLYRQLRQRLRQDTRFLWSARSMRHYCDLCGVNGERLNDSQRAMLRALLARA